MQKSRLMRDPADPGTALEGDQLGELGRDVCHRLFCSAQAGSRGEQGADFAESFIRRVVHDGNEPVTREECRKFFVGDALCWGGGAAAQGSPARSRFASLPSPCRWRASTARRGQRPSR